MEEDTLQHLSPTIREGYSRWVTLTIVYNAQKEKRKINNIH